MLNFHINFSADSSSRVLFLGAHSDDIEIGCGGMLNRVARAPADIQIACVVFSAKGVRAQETRDALISLMADSESSTKSKEAAAACKSVNIRCEEFRDGFFPSAAETIKEYFETLKKEFNPDLIFTHFKQDAHQDHRLINQLTWNTFRSNAILEYEIPKYDGDLNNPTSFLPLTHAQAMRKAQIIYQSFESQQHRQWFDVETFMALMRLRGVQCNAPEGYAEGFYSRKQWLSL